ncbi:MAG TPA: hypothetical protein VFE43_04935 [Candidatus Binataceae bacterium]|nr:hypothetical protein [Candidatus Binataceae bacterium]
MVTITPNKYEENQGRQYPDEQIQRIDFSPIDTEHRRYWNDQKTTDEVEYQSCYSGKQSGRYQDSKFDATQTAIRKPVEIAFRGQPEQEVCQYNCKPCF